MLNNWIPDGGKYTRPRRGYRAKSHYRDRLRKRGVVSTDVRMEPLDVLRKRQGRIPGFADSSDSPRSVDTGVLSSDSGLQMSRRMPEMAPNYSLENGEESPDMERTRHGKG